MKNKLQAILCVMLLGLLWISQGWAKNIDLSTLPSRHSIQMTIYNSADLTLVKETRYITFKRGNNQLQFSWSGTLIDPTSVELRPLEKTDDIEVIDTTFPGQKPKHLLWNVRSKYEGQVKVEVSYFTSGLTWTMDYVAITDPGETNMKFRGYVRVFNRSGETYPNAQVRLIVGHINLVEKIADLARREGIKDVKKLSPPAYRRLRVRAFGKAAAMAESARTQPKQIVKQGLSEYFMFTIEGHETIRNGWSKRLQAVKAEVPKFETVYRMRTHQYGPKPVRFFIWRNAEEYKLGDSPLPNGQIRIFRENENKGLSYLGEQKLRYVPIKAAIEINLGADPLVILQAKKLQTQRMNFYFRHNYKQDYVAGWDELQMWQYTVRNYRDKPITLALQQQWSGDIHYASTAPTKQVDYRTVQTTWTLKANSMQETEVRVLQRHGTRHKQSRVQIQEWK